MVRFCTECGVNFTSDTDKFCGACGFRRGFIQAPINEESLSVSHKQDSESATSVLE